MSDFLKCLTEVADLANKGQSVTDDPKEIAAMTDELREAIGHVRYVHKAFSNDLSLGYKTRDKEFAVNLLGEALRLFDGIVKPEVQSRSRRGKTSRSWRWKIRLSGPASTRTDMSKG